jgi:uncharacterized membrane protein
MDAAKRRGSRQAENLARGQKNRVLVMADDRTRAAPLVDEASHADAPQEPVLPHATVRQRGSLKDRIADLSIGAKATVAERLKAVQGAAPAADDIRNKIRGAAAAVRFDRLNRDTLKAGRDGLAAKVEALLKPRPAADAALTGMASTPSQSTHVETAEGVPLDVAPLATEPATTPSSRNIGLIKARVDDALKAEPRPPQPASLREQTAVTTPPAATEVSVMERETWHPTRSVTFTNRPLPTAYEDAPNSVGSGQAPAPETKPDPTIEPATERTRSLNTRRIVQAEAAAERSRPIFTLGMLATALTAGGVLHILTTFAVPWMNASSAFERLRFKLEPNAMRVFPSDANGQTPLPFLSADLRYAICRYDLTANSVIISATLPDIGWSLALYTPQGDNFYAVPGQDGRVVTAQFTLNIASDRLLLPVPGVRRSDTDATQVTSPNREGLVVIRAPNLGPAQQASIEEALGRSTCRTTPRR